MDISIQLISKLICSPVWVTLGRGSLPAKFGEQLVDIEEQNPW